MDFDDEAPVEPGPPEELVLFVSLDDEEEESDEEEDGEPPASEVDPDEEPEFELAAARLSLR